MNSNFPNNELLHHQKMRNLSLSAHLELVERRESNTLLLQKAKKTKRGVEFVKQATLFEYRSTNRLQPLGSGAVKLGSLQPLSSSQKKKANPEMECELQGKHRPT